MIIQQRCPICEGHGQVVGGFYNTIAGCQSVSSSVFETCKNCLGTGVVSVGQWNNEKLNPVCTCPYGGGASREPDPESDCEIHGRI